MLLLLLGCGQGAISPAAARSVCKNINANAWMMDQVSVKAQNVWSLYSRKLMVSLPMRVRLIPFSSVGFLSSHMIFESLCSSLYVSCVCFCIYVVICLPFPMHWSRLLIINKDLLTYLLTYLLTLDNWRPEISHIL